MNSERETTGSWRDDGASVGLEEPIALNVEAWLPRLTALVASQESMFARLEMLCQRQAGLVRAEETDLLLALLAERRSIVENIAEASAALAPFRRRWDAVLAALPDEKRGEIQRRLRLISETAARIASQDEADRRVMEQRRDAIADEMAGLSRGRGAVAAYGGRVGDPTPRYQDREA